MTIEQEFSKLNSKMATEIYRNSRSDYSVFRLEYLLER